MRTVCAWCGKHLSGDENDLKVSHGICEECAAREFGPDESGGADETP